MKPRGSSGDPHPAMDDEDVAELMRVGVPEATARAELARRAATREPEPEPEFVLSESLWPAVRLFSALDTQWRVVAGSGGMVRLGLDYGAIPVTARLMGLKDEAMSRTLFQQLRILEDETLKICAPQRASH